MKEKDYIYVYDDKGRRTKMELVIAISSPDNTFSYIAYKEENKVVPLYLAKLYIEENGISKLDTNLTNEEQQMIMKIIRKEVIGDKNE